MKRWNDRGQTLVFIARAIMAILGFAALGIDVGFMYSVRHELQRSADTGALAGASRFIESGGEWSPDPTDPAMVAADLRARQFASMDPVATTPLDPAAEVVVAFPSLYRIQVTTLRTVPLSFARVFGRDNSAISATAVAEAAVADRNVQCLQPWGIPIPWNDVNNNDKYDPPSAGGQDELWELDKIAEGTLMILKIGEPYNKDNTLDIPTLQQEAGHFFGLAMCGDSGAADYKKRIEDPCWDGCGIDNNSPVPVEPGNMVGPTKQAVAELIRNDRNAQWVGPTAGDREDWVSGSTAAGGWDNSSRLVKIPLYDPSNMLSSGRNEIIVAGFAAFWLEDYDSKMGTVVARFVSSNINGSSTSGPAPGLALRVLRLVQ
jgi:hypothetical protein